MTRVKVNLESNNEGKGEREGKESNEKGKGVWKEEKKRNAEGIS